MSGSGRKIPGSRLGRLARLATVSARTGANMLLNREAATEEVARKVIPFVEGNGDVTLDDIAEYTRLDRKVLRHHLGVLCKEGRLERIGVGRHAIYSAVV